MWDPHAGIITDEKQALNLTELSLCLNGDLSMYACMYVCMYEDAFMYTTLNVAVSVFMTV